LPTVCKRHGGDRWNRPDWVEDRPRFRLILWAAPTLWLCGHALFHFWEVAVGICGLSVLARDFAAVTLPAIIGIALTL
jgi:hypothetical protein